MNGSGECAELRASRSGSRGRLVSGAALAALSGLVGCGASIQAVYESDVRFEHCMALDREPEVQPAIQRACWTEWLAGYTYGQTRDRVVYAQQRLSALEIEQGGEGATSVASLIEPLSAPEPQSPHAGPPILAQRAADAGSPEGDAGLPSASAEAGALRTRCLERCVGVRDECRGQCRSAACEKGCSDGFGSCVNECPP